MRRREIFGTVLKVLAAFSPAVVLGCLVAANAVNTPVWDDWERGPLLEKWHAGTLMLADLYAPHIDHRMFFPRLIILVLNEWSGGDLRWEMAVTWLMAVAAGVGLWRLAKGSIFEGRTVWGIVFLMNLIIFSPIQWDNWVWGVQIAFLMPMTFIIWSLVVCQTSWRWWRKLVTCAVLALIATHSFGHGFAVWPVVLGMAVFSGRFAPTLRERWCFAGIWGALAAVVIGCYALVGFHNTSDETHSYGRKPGESPPGVVNRGQILEAPGHAARFIATLAGNPFARLHLVDPVEFAPVVGAVILTAFLGLAGLAFWLRRRMSAAWEAQLPWIALGTAALLGMAAIAVGRLNFAGYTRAASIRYVSISQYLPVAVLALSVFWWRSRVAVSSSPALRQWGPLALAVFVGFMIPAWNFGAQMMPLCRDARLQGKAALMFINFFNPQVGWRIDGSVSFPRKYANVLNELGLLDAPLVRSLELRQFDPVQKERTVSQAAVYGFERTCKEGVLKAWGHARIELRPADLVLFTWEADGMEPMIFATAEPTTEMVQQAYPNDLELVGRLKPGKWDFCHWKRELNLEDIGFLAFPSIDEVTVKAWSFDVERRRAYRIAGEWKVTRAGEVQPAGRLSLSSNDTP